MLCAAVAVPAVAHRGKGKSKGHKPDVIALPNGFQPEGIATGKRHTFFVGSRATGAIYKGSLRSGKGEILVEGGSGPRGDRPEGRPPQAPVRVRRRQQGHPRLRHPHRRRDPQLPGAGGRLHQRQRRHAPGRRTSPTRRSSSSTSSRSARRARWASCSGSRSPATSSYGAGFNANGIEKAKGGKTLILVKSSDPGKLYTADAATGVTKEIALDEPVTNGDGLLRKGRKLYVVLNRDNVVRELRLSKDLSSAHHGARHHRRRRSTSRRRSPARAAATTWSTRSSPPRRPRRTPTRW